jgi:uncharacterized protein (TIGR02145 family)
MPTLKQNEIFANRYQLIKKLGVGGYSEVWLAKDNKAGGMEVALKIYSPEKGLDDKGLETFSKEFSLAFNLNHAGLLKPIYFDDYEGSPFLVMPYCKNASMADKIGNISEKELAAFIFQATSALAYLHKKEPPIIHQDIKPDNFLIDDEGNYLLADFGISSKIRKTLTKTMGEKNSSGTMAYMPPEKFSRERLTIKAGDIFSLGITLYELLTGELAFGEHGGIALFSGAEIPDLPKQYSSELNEVVRSCMAKDPWDRPTADTLMEIAKNYELNAKWDISKLPIVKKEVHEEQIIIPKEPDKPKARVTIQIPVNKEETEKKQPIAKPPFDSFGKPILFIGIVIALIFTSIYFVKNYDPYTVEIVKDENISTYGSFTDSRDGKIYKTIIIGNQTWMAENLAYTGNNGFQKKITDADEWGNNLNYDGWCYYDNDSSNGNEYGVLYQWEAAKNACPEGWHLPTDDEWRILIDYIGGEEIAGAKLKEAGVMHWISPNSDANNVTGFTALPGGFRDYSGYFNIDNSGHWWSSSTETNTTNAWSRFMFYDYSGADRISNVKTNGFSVRCLRD